jgi:GNAT superfamily N-acetyltransferase
MSRLEIRERDFNSFFKAPYNAYRENSLFVSQMKGDLKRFLSLKNPLFKSDDDFTFFTVHRDQRPVGRIVVHVHQASNEKYKQKKASFGFFDVEDNFSAAEMLLHRAEDWAKARGFASLTGNFNLTAMQQMGVMIGGFTNPPYVDFVWNAPHVPELLDKLGYKRDFFMNTFEVSVDRVDLDRLMSPKIKALLEDTEYDFVELNKKNISEHLNSMRLILNDGFSENPFFVPLTEAEMDFQSKDLSLIMDEKISALIKHKSDAVGTIVCIPNLNPLLRATGSKIGITTPYHFYKFSRNCDSALLIFASVNKAYQNTGLSAAMLVHMIQALREGGYKKFGVTWVSDANKPVHVLLEKLGAVQLHRLCLFTKNLSKFNLSAEISGGT